MYFARLLKSETIGTLPVKICTFWHVNANVYAVIIVKSFVVHSVER